MVWQTTKCPSSQVLRNKKFSWTPWMRRRIWECSPLTTWNHQNSANRYMAQLDNNLALMRLTGMQLRHDCVSACRTCAIDKGKKDKGRVKVYSAFTAGLYSSHSRRWGMDHSFTCKLHHTCLYLVRVHQMEPASNCRLLSFIDPESLKGWVGLVGSDL